MQRLRARSSPLLVDIANLEPIPCRAVGRYAESRPHLVDLEHRLLLRIRHFIC